MQGDHLTQELPFRALSQSLTRPSYDDTTPRRVHPTAALGYSRLGTFKPGNLDPGL